MRTPGVDMKVEEGTQLCLSRIPVAGVEGTRG